MLTTNLSFAADCLSLKMKFPVYRKYINGLSWFRIDSPESFEEIRKIGSKYIRTEHQVKILPERNMVHDLLFEFGSFAVEIEAAEYAEIAVLAQISDVN
jgi:hypothetical protein